jgi:hypothetical protein
MAGASGSSFENDPESAESDPVELAEFIEVHPQFLLQYMAQLTYI